MALTSKLTQVLVNIKDGAITGAQATYEEYHPNGEFVGTRTTGLNTGLAPEYELELETVLGQALKIALQENALLQNKIKETN